MMLAADKLVYSNESILTIAEGLGYGSGSAFSNASKESWDAHLVAMVKHRDSK
jgi:hypothetical protein